MDSATTLLPKVDRPAHVPAELEVDFDVYRPPGYEDDVQLAWARLLDGPPVVWTPYYGGHWIAGRGSVVREVQLDWPLFSHAAFTIPRSATPSLPVEIDPPEHGPLRALLSPLFSPRVLREVEGEARALTNTLMDDFADRGECDFAEEFSRKFPIVIFLKLVDLPLDAREMLIGLAELRVRSIIPEERNEAKVKILAFLASAIAERRLRPRGDFISQVLQGQIGGRPINDWEAENMLATLLSGGLDTVASMLGFSMRSLALRPDLQDRLAADPTLAANAADELLRRHGVANTTRLIMYDTEFHGAQLRKGEQIAVPNTLIGLSPDIFEDPTRLDFDRFDPGRHGAFGNGPHRCPAANLARLELRVVLQEWFRRIPRFALNPDKPVMMASGMVSTVHSLPLVWDVA